MPRYVVSGVVHAGVYVEVEADNPAAARAAAEELGVQGLCHQCSTSRRGEARVQWRLSDGLGDIVEIGDDDPEEAG